jgi:glycosyltransferase involved in cell wall biosynthesis
MKKILYIVSTLKRSGPIIVLANIVKYLDISNFEPIVLTLSPEPKDSMKEYFEDMLNTKVETLGLSRLQGLVFAKSHIEKFIKENDISIVHTHGFRADGMSSKLADIKSVSTLHNYPFYDYAMTYGKVKGYIMARIHLKYLKKLNSPLACSKSISIMLKNNISYHINYLQNGTDTQRFENLDKKALREKLGIDQGIKLFVSVGHLSSRKDPLTVIKAFQNAQIEYSKLIFLGDGNLHSECVSAIGEDKSIELIGKVDNVHEYLGASDYFVTASLAEGLPNTVLEAMACGLPCILSNIPPHAEIHEINRNSSLMFETKDVKSLSDKLKEIITKDYEVMKNASKEIIFNNLSAEIMSKNYQKIYEILLLESNK